jgi:nucleoside-diphosphate-sugar epimerase
VKALVTGAAGFVGRHMVRELQARGYDVDVCDIAFKDESGLPRDAKFLFTHNTIIYDLVVHAAAVAPHRVAIDGEPIRLIENVHLDSAMFGWAVSTRQKRVLYLSSSAAYPVHLQIAATSPLIPRLQEDEIDLDWPELADGRYGFTKLVGEHMARAARECGLPVTVVRPFSGYGEDQGTDWPFGAFVKRIVDHETPFTVWGSELQLRDWIHISDVVKGALAVVENGTEEPVNLCTGRPTAMSDLAHIMMDMADYGDFERKLNVDESKPLGVMNRVGEPSRLWEIYIPEVTLEEGVARTLAGAGVI